MSADGAPTRADVLGTMVHALTSEDFVRIALSWAVAGESRTVCFCNVHSVVTARHLGSLAVALREADLVLPDGAPIAWMLRRRGHPDQERLPGPDATLTLARAAGQHSLPVFLYGGTARSVEALRMRLIALAPGLPVVGAYSPPFRPLSPAEEEADWARIREAGAKIVFVGLGCPKQEIWLHRARGRIPAVALGVGAAFDFLSGEKARAPRWARRVGLEWGFRLIQEPRRLGPRYLRTNIEFLRLAGLDILRGQPTMAARRPGARK